DNFRKQGFAFMLTSDPRWLYSFSVEVCRCKSFMRIPEKIFRYNWFMVVHNHFSLKGYPPTNIDRVCKNTLQPVFRGFIVSRICSRFKLLDDKAAHVSFGQPIPRKAGIDTAVPQLPVSMRGNWRQVLKTA